MAAISKAWVAIADSAVDPDSPGDSTLLTAVRDDLVHLREWLGASFFAGAVQDHNHDGSNSAAIEVGPNLLRNGSFEDGEAGWTIVDFSGGSHAFSTSTRHHGEQSLAFTSTVLANGGGNALSGEFIPVAGLEWYDWSAQISASVANVSSRVGVIWYDADQAQISEVNVYNVTNTPTTKTEIGRGAQAPSTARFAKLRVTGGVPGAGSATGTIFFDDVQYRIAGKRVLIEEQEAASSSSLDFTTGIDGSFAYHELELDSIVPATNSVAMLIRMDTDGGASFDAGASDYTFANVGRSSTGSDQILSSAGDTVIRLTGSALVANSSTDGMSGVVKLFRLAISTGRKYTTHQVVYHNSSPAQIAVHGGGFTNSSVLSTNPVNALRLLASSGNLSTGKARLFGVRKK